MATREEKRARAINDFLKENPNASNEVKEAGIRAIGAPSQAATDEVWRTLTFGLLVILIVALFGVLLLLRVGGDNSHESVVTIFTTTLAGLLGLFAPSPLRSGSREGSDGNGQAGGGAGGARVD